jgi:predicted glycosyltransferase
VRVWIDLSNSPHPLLFAPIARRLEEEGHSVHVTVRDNAQTLQLARERFPTITLIGGPAPPSRAGKARAIAGRVRTMTSWARRHRVDVALSHNSYAQAVAARALRLPVVTAMDYEHQPANHLAFRLAHRILLPSALPVDLVRGQGAVDSKVVVYPGLKEELYLGDFTPDRGVLDAAGAPRDGGPLVVTRTPPAGASYHRMANDPYYEGLRAVCRDGVRCVILPRFPEQREQLLSLELPGAVIPERAVDSRSLMYMADLVIGAGGTMTREAALMGVPTASVYAGGIPAVEQALEADGRIRRVESPADLAPVRPRATEPRSLDELRAASERQIDVWIDTVLTR